jgi:hypothetical protein
MSSGKRIGIEKLIGETLERGSFQLGGVRDHRWRRNNRLGWLMVILVLTVIVSPFVVPLPARACSPMPWTFSQASEGSVAALYGLVSHVSEDGRQATLEVRSYAGPDKAPQKVVLPSTVDSQDRDRNCPDFSVKFKTGQQYVVFLADISPSVKLAYPEWITAFPVQDGQVTIGYPEGEQAALDPQMKQFADMKKTSVQFPTRSSPVWYSSGHSGIRMAILGGISVVVIGAAAAIWLRSRRKNKLV